LESKQALRIQTGTHQIPANISLPANIYANEGMCQILFFHSEELCLVSHADHEGKYQKQQGIVLLKL
jgi:dCTP deaminase